MLLKIFNLKEVLAHTSALPPAAIIKSEINAIWHIADWGGVKGHETASMFLILHKFSQSSVNMVTTTKKSKIEERR